MRTEFHIEPPHDAGKAGRIKAQFENTAGVRNIQIYPNGKTVVVDFDETTVQRETLLKKIQDLGIGVTIGEQESGI
jgi:copper chaperone CopZ